MHEFFFLSFSVRNKFYLEARLFFNLDLKSSFVHNIHYTPNKLDSLVKFRNKHSSFYHLHTHTSSYKSFVEISFFFSSYFLNTQMASLTFLYLKSVVIDDKDIKRSALVTVQFAMCVKSIKLEVCVKSIKLEDFKAYRKHIKAISV